MKKYFLKKNHSEVKLGDKVQISTNADTSYGKGITQVNVTLTEANLKKLIKDGFIITEEVNGKALMNLLKPYFIEASKEAGFPSYFYMMLLSVLFKISKKVHLLMIIEILSKVKNRNRKRGDIVFHLNPAANFKPTEVIGNTDCITVFYCPSDAGDVYNLLLPFIDDLSGE